jgi:hypothetical protein
MGQHDDLGLEATAEMELDRQVRTLLDKDYPALAGLTEHAFVALVEPLRKHLPDLGAADPGHIPFVVVVTSALVPTVAAVERFVVGGNAGFTDMAAEIDGYRPIDGLDLPTGSVYLLVDVDTGADTLNVPPNDALPRLVAAGRTPLTVDEGVAVVTHVPDVFRARNAFQALGSRAGNKRIPSFWMSKGAPRLGWCWAGNPHTWLGAASAAARHGSG